MGMKFVGLLAVGAGALYAVSMVDRGMNYDMVDTKVTSAIVDCYVKARKSELVEKDSNKTAYMDCSMAPFAAEKFGYDKSDIKKRVKLTFKFKSPVDGSWQAGEHEVNDATSDYKNGQSIQIYGHKNDAKKYRWS